MFCTSVGVVRLVREDDEDEDEESSVWPLVRIYRGGFLLIEFLFLLGINTYGWRQAGVNHVLIFELNPRNNLSHQHLFEVTLISLIEVLRSKMNVIFIFCEIKTNGVL